MFPARAWRSRYVVFLSLATLAGGCAVHVAPATVPSRPTEGGGVRADVSPRPTPAEKPGATAAVATAESSTPGLAQALRDLESAHTAAAHRRVAEAYYRAGILDQAHDQFARAAQLDPADGSAYEGMARIWRDYGTPGLGLGDAHRATYYLPDSPQAHNTLGTLLFALGRLGDARVEFERALRLAPGADYALGNLCYVAVAEGRGDEAVAVCRRAVEADPAWTGARNNLALAYALDGHFDLAEREFMQSGDPASAQYNLGIVLMAARRYREAATALAAAARLKPTLPFVAERARQASLLAGSPDARH